MMLKKKSLIAMLSAVAALPAWADDAPAFTPSANVSLVSDYLYRGISQTGTNPAIQGGFDLAHSSGLYVGAWGSSISFTGDAGINTAGTTGVANAGLELDTYAGYKGTAANVGYDVGYLRYNYPGTYTAGFTKYDTDELYGALSYSIVTAKLSYSLGDLFGVANAKGSTYAELNASYPVADTGFTLGAHVGKQTYKGSAADALTDTATYTDYKLSASKDFGGYVVGLAYSSTNASPFYTNLQGKKLGKSTAVFSLSRTF